MQFYVARQPIFNPKLEVQAYELLFRSSMENIFQHADENQASSSVLTHTFIDLGMESVTGGQRAFINFTRDLILREFATMFDPNLIVVELLETIKPDPPVIQACRKLKEMGYTLALDDFQYTPDYEPLIEIADIIKVDFMMSDRAERKRFAESFLPRGKTMLAEKVELQEEFAESREWGYTLFQGYFFSKPVIVAGERLPDNKASALMLIRVVQDHDLDWEKVEEVIKRDVALSYKLLRYINSAFFGMQNPVSSIRQALTLLGMRAVRKWASLVALACIAEDMPAELIRISLIRASFCEQLAAYTGFTARGQDLFLLGMFSMLDRLMNRPMEDLLVEIPFAPDLKQALLGEPGRLRDIYEIVLCYENARWERLDELTATFSVQHDVIPTIYEGAIEWAEAVMNENDRVEA